MCLDFRRAVQAGEKYLGDNQCEVIYRAMRLNATIRKFRVDQDKKAKADPRGTER